MVQRQREEGDRETPLPDQVEADKIAAEFKDGVLEIRIPKEERVKPKQIKVEAL